MDYFSIVYIKILRVSTAINYYCTHTQYWVWVVVARTPILGDRAFTPDQVHLCKGKPVGYDFWFGLTCTDKLHSILAFSNLDYNIFSSGSIMVTE